MHLSTMSTFKIFLSKQFEKSQASIPKTKCKDTHFDQKDGIV